MIFSEKGKNPSYIKADGFKQNGIILNKNKMTLDKARVLFENDFEQLSDEELENFVLLVDAVCKLVLNIYRESDLQTIKETLQTSVDFSN